MTWQTVSNKLYFWSSVQQWVTLTGWEVSAFTSFHEGLIRDHIYALYHNSDTAQSMLDSYIGDIRIGHHTGTTGFAAINIPHRYMGLDLIETDKFYYFDVNGVLVKERPELTIAHELIHMHTNNEDPAGDDLSLNSSSHDYYGPVITLQNNIAEEMGFSSNIRAGYFSTVMYDQIVANGLVIGDSYSFGNLIEIARVGTYLDDNMDMESRTDNLDYLILGLEGDDYIAGGGGEDYLYGGLDSDYVRGANGDDTLFGGRGSDDLFGGDGNDALIELTENGIFNYLYGEGGNDYVEVTMSDNHQENDYFYSIISGREGNDFINVKNFGLATAGRNHIASVEFNLEDGNDIIMSAVNIFEFSPSLMTLDDFDHVQSNLAMSQYGVLSVSYGVAKSDIEFVWEGQKVGESDIFDFNPYNDYDEYVEYYSGDLAIVISSTGDSIFFEDASAFRWNSVSANGTVNGLWSFLIPTIYTTDGYINAGDLAPFGGSPAEVSLIMSSTDGYVPSMPSFAYLESQSFVV